MLNDLPEIQEAMDLLSPAERMAVMVADYLATGRVCLEAYAGMHCAPPPD